MASWSTEKYGKISKTEFRAPLRMKTEFMVILL